MLKEIRVWSRDVIIVLLVVLAGLWVYRWQNHFAFPGIFTRALFVLSIVVIIWFLFSSYFYRMVCWLQEMLLRLGRKRKRRHIAKLIRHVPLRKAKYAQKELVEIVINTCFQLALLVFLVLVIAKEFVSVSWNMNYVMIAIIALGIIAALFPRKMKPVKSSSRKEYVFLIFLGIIGMVLVFWKTASLGKISWFLSGGAGLLIVLLSWLIMRGDDEKK